MSDTETIQNDQKLVAVALSDEAPTARLPGDTATTMQESGIGVPDGMMVKVVSWSGAVPTMSFIWSCRQAPAMNSPMRV